MTTQLPMPLDMLPTQASHGAVYTKPWVVDLLLDLAGYVTDADLAVRIAVEPAVGDGAFLTAMARRLVASCRRYQRDLGACRTALQGFDLDPQSVATARAALVATLVEDAVEPALAAALASSWVRQGNYLLVAPTLPAADVVVGNPPYIRLEEIGAEIAATYRTMYPTMTGRADLYVAFFEAGLRQLKPDGVCAFICADRWMLNQYGAGLRTFIAAGFSVDTVVEMHTADAFERDVSAYPAITVVRRAPQGAVVVARADATAAASGGSRLAAALRRARADELHGGIPAGLVTTRVDTWFSGSDPWPCASPARLRVLRYLEEHFEPLESARTGTRVGIGVATGADTVFLTTDPEIVESSRLLPLAMASDTLTGELQWSGTYLIDPWDDQGLVDVAQYPRLAAYFATHRDTLLRRHVAQRRPAHWYRTIDRVTHQLARRPKLYLPDIKHRIHPVLDPGSTYPHHNLYFIQSDAWDLEVLGGLLLSDIGQFFVECYGVRMRGGWLRFQAQYLRRIRVPGPDRLTPAQAAELRAAFRCRDTAAATRVALDVYRLEALPMDVVGHDAVVAS